MAGYDLQIVNATSVVAIVGLITTAATALGVPFIQGRIAARTAADSRLHERRLAVYTDAMVYLQSVEALLDELVLDPDLRSGIRPPDLPHEGLITARLRLLVPRETREPWAELVSAWKTLRWNAEQDGPANDHGDYHLPAENSDVVRVQAAGQALSAALRRAMDLID